MSFPCFPSLFSDGRNGWPPKVNTVNQVTLSISSYHFWLFERKLTLICYVVFRSISEEFKVPDGMVGFSKWLGLGLTLNSEKWFSNVYIKRLEVTLFFFFFFNIVIGRGGEQISRLQQESGCKIQIAPGKICCWYCGCHWCQEIIVLYCWGIAITVFFLCYRQWRNAR